MKKLFTVLSLLVVVALGATDKNQIIPNNHETTFTENQESQKRVEYKFEINNGFETCYERTCLVGSVTNPDGTIKEFKVCSDWKEVTCPEDPKPQGPSTSFGIY